MLICYQHRSSAWMVSHDREQNGVPKGGDRGLEEAWRPFWILLSPLHSP